MSVNNTIDQQVDALDNTYVLDHLCEYDWIEFHEEALLEVYVEHHFKNWGESPEYRFKEFCTESYNRLHTHVCECGADVHNGALCNYCGR